jgi:succinate-semialdehyde dehydrogenase/glutarate-semialdehyde dehydrogenase
VCIAGKRFIIDERVYDEYLKALINELKTNYVVGDPSDPKVNIGPMARPDILEGFKEQLRKTLELGGKLVYGSKDSIYEKTAVEKGNYFSPVIIEDVPKNSPGFREEIFGPAFMMFKFKTEQKAIELANDSEYGLG